jgi:Activator of Hsp90 ATPase homolog 1-like protein
MHAPDGTDFPNRTNYLEVEKCAKLVYDDGASDEQHALFRVTVLFSEIKGRTKMEMSMTLPTPEAAEETRKFIKQAGGDSTWDRLSEYLQIEKPHRRAYTQQFCDENEKISRHPMAPTWPETMLTTVDLAAEGPDRTRVTVTWEPCGPALAKK